MNQHYTQLIENYLSNLQIILRTINNKMVIQYIILFPVIEGKHLL